MPDYFIRPMDSDELKRFYRNITEDFAPGEYAPYEVLYEQLQNGIQEGLVFCEGQKDLAYAICAAGHPNGYVLVSLLAVLKEYRGGGIGTAFMKELIKRYADKQALLLEVEKPELSETDKEYVLSRRRIDFYEKMEFYLIPDIDYVIWYVPMHLMALPLKASREIINAGIGKYMYEVYLQLMGKRYIHMMKLKVRDAEG